MFMACLHVFDGHRMPTGMIRITTRPLGVQTGRQENIVCPWSGEQRPVGVSLNIKISSYHCGISISQKKRPEKSCFTHQPLIDAAVILNYFQTHINHRYLEQSCEIALRWMPKDTFDDKSTLVQVMAWCCQATSHYMNQCWPRSPMLYGVIRPQWVKVIAWCCQATSHYQGQCGSSNSSSIIFHHHHMASLVHNHIMVHGHK